MPALKDKKDGRKSRKKDVNTFHYIYKIHFLCGFPTGRYYIGKRTYHGNSIDKDSYAGSGQFCFAYYKKYGKVQGVTYIKEILEINPSKVINADREDFWIGDLWKTDPLCMNQMPGGLCKVTTEDGDVLAHAKTTSVRQYDMDGNFIKEWDSITDAEEAFGIYNIGACCRKLRRESGGFMWRYSSENIDKLDSKESLAKHSRAVKQYDLEGNFIKEFDRIQDAANELNMSKKGIQECCAGRQKSAGGYIWKYVNPDYVRPCNRDLDKCGAIKISQYSLDGVFIETFDSINAATRKTGINPNTISKCCKGLATRAGNYKWKYVN